MNDETVIAVGDWVEEIGAEWCFGDVLSIDGTRVTYHYRGGRTSSNDLDWDYVKERHELRRISADEAVRRYVRRENHACDFTERLAIAKAASESKSAQECEKLKAVIAQRERSAADTAEYARELEKDVADYQSRLAPGRVVHIGLAYEALRNGHRVRHASWTAEAEEGKEPTFLKLAPNGRIMRVFGNGKESWWLDDFLQAEIEPMPTWTILPVETA